MKKSNRVYFLLVLLFLFVPATLPAQIDDCFMPAYQQGVRMMEKGDFVNAIRYFEAALSCPTCPSDNKAQEKIDECRAKLGKTNVALTVDGGVFLRKSVAGQGGSFTFNVSTTADDWQFTDTLEWVEARAISKTELFVICRPNTLPEERQASVSVQAGNKEAVIIITQSIDSCYYDFQITQVYCANVDEKGQVIGNYGKNLYKEGLHQIRLLVDIRSLSKSVIMTDFDVIVQNKEQIAINRSFPVHLEPGSSQVQLLLDEDFSSLPDGRYNVCISCAGKRLYSSCLALSSKGQSDTMLSSEPLSSTPMLKDGHECVDMGLSVKWATMNIGASLPDEYGDYYSWGEIKTKNVYDMENYDQSIYSKYVTKNSPNASALELCDDVARTNWSGAWRMPTQSEWQELESNCDKRLARTAEGSYYMKYISRKNGNYIIFPYGGYRDGLGIDSEGISFEYWSSSLSRSNARAFSFHSQNDGISGCNLYYGMNVRPVHD